MWLSKAHGPGVTNWLANGMYHDALHGDWPEDDGTD